jgi:hypothetical protein
LGADQCDKATIQEGAANCASVNGARWQQRHRERPLLAGPVEFRRQAGVAFGNPGEEGGMQVAAMHRSGWPAWSPAKQQAAEVDVGPHNIRRH